jgi:amidase
MTGFASGLVRAVLAAALIGGGTSPASGQSPLAAERLLKDATIEQLSQAMENGTLTSEALVEMYLERVAAYDQNGPALNSILTLNQGALARARELDAERAERGPRSMLHGIPVVLKDNVDTRDMPTTAGSILLQGSFPPDDAFMVQRLRNAGAIILAKTNMSEFASGATMSSNGGWIRNPHDLDRTPAGSSGGSGAAIAAVFAQLGIGTDTGGSVRGPSAANGIVGLKPTHGLVSRDGIIPLALSFDTGGPMARSVYDVAAMMNVIAGIDPNDEATRKADGRVPDDYTAFLDENALAGARIGVARQFLGGDPDVDWVIEASLRQIQKQGAVLVDVELPQWLIDVKGDWYTTIRWREFREQIPAYLATTGPEFPKRLADLLDRSRDERYTTDQGGTPNPVRWSLFAQEEDSGRTTDTEYRTMVEFGQPMIRSLIDGLFNDERLDAIVYPTSGTRPERVWQNQATWDVPSATNLANLTGYPDLIIPAGFTSDNLPVALSFFGPAFSEPTLLGLGFSFESRNDQRPYPAMTPAIDGHVIRR